MASFAARADEREDAVRFVAIDGKTLCNSHGARDRANPLHLVSAWASDQGLTLGQAAVADKSNEIIAIPRLLELLELSGALVSIDAMGCQKEIAAAIVEADADYVLAVKGNQPKLAAAIEQFFESVHEHSDFSERECRQHHTTERSRGRHEERSYAVAPLPEEMKHFVREMERRPLDRPSHQPHDARRKANQRSPVLHQQPRTARPRIRHRRPPPLVDREHALDSGCRVRRR